MKLPAATKMGRSPIEWGGCNSEMRILDGLKRDWGKFNVLRVAFNSVD